MKNFTFKTNYPTGAYRTFSSPSVDIKLNKIICGSIGCEHPHKIKLMVIKKDINEDGNTNCKWKWIQFKSSFESLEKAKDFLNSKEIKNHIDNRLTIFLDNK